MDNIEIKPIKLTDKEKEYILNDEVAVEEMLEFMFPEHEDKSKVL